MTDRDSLNEMMKQLQEQYPDRHALEQQPDWIDDLNDAHSSIEMAYVRQRGSSPEPKIELNVQNTVSGEDGWHRIEATEQAWFYPHEHPPAGITAALQWLRENVPVVDFRNWFEQQ